jgi:predicted nucleic acid-binding protein
MILLDADVLIDVSRHFPPAAAWPASLSNQQIAAPGYVIMELVEGCRNRQDQQRMEALANQFDVVWPTVAGCQEALALFRRFHLSHHLGLLDALIAATAIELNVPLHTFNVKHFQHVPQLRIVQPYVRQQP